MPGIFDFVYTTLGLSRQRNHAQEHTMASMNDCILCARYRLSILILFENI